MSTNKRPRSLDDEGTLPKKRAKSVTDEGEVFICPICMEPVTMYGSHFIVATKCGHLFGDSCLRKWLSECPIRLRNCPTCKAWAVEDDIRKLYSQNIVILDGQSDAELIEVKKKLDRLQNEMDMLQALGIKYCKCQFCDMAFYNEAQKIQHRIQQHPDSFHQPRGCRAPTKK